MAKIQEVLHADSDTTAEPLTEVQYDDDYNVFANDKPIINTCVVEMVNSNIIPDSPNMCDNDDQTDQNTKECDDERAALANLIVNLTLDTKENKKILKQLKKANASWTHELEKCKTKLEETTKALGETTSSRIVALVHFKTNRLSLRIVKQKHDELVKQSLLTKLNFEGLLKEKSQVIRDLKDKESKYIDKLISMEKQLKFLNEIVYKRNLSIHTIHMLATKGSTYNGRLTFANPMYLKKAQSEIPCLYEILYDKSDLANIFGPEWEETVTLEKESRSKLDKDLVKPYDYTKQNNLYENFKPASQEDLEQLARIKEVRKKIEIIDQAWFKHTSDRFRAPTSLDIEVLIKTCLMPLASKTQNDSHTFVHELKQEIHEDLKYVESLEKEIDELEYDKADFSNMYDLLIQKYVSKDRMCSYLHFLSDLDALAKLQCLYMYKVKECECLAIKLSKQTKNASKEDTVRKENGSNVFLKEREQYQEIQDLKAQLQDNNIAISELKKLVEKCKGKSIETHFDKPYVVQQPNAQRIPKPSVLGKLTPFSNSPEVRFVSKKELVNKTNVLDGSSKQVTQQILPQNRKQAGNNLLTGNHESDLYTISLQETTSSTPIYFMAKASPTQAWLWHRRLSHLNFNYINLLSKKDVVIGLPKLTYVKDQLCSSYELSKAKRSSSKDETPEVLKDFLKMIQRNLQAQVITVHTDRGTKFLNKTLHAYFKEERIEHQTSTPRTPEQNDVIKRQNRTLVEADRMMLLASKLPLFFCAEAIAIACYTQTRSIIILTHEKTAYHIINDRKPSTKHLYIFGCTCYLSRDGENLDKMKEKGDPCPVPQRQEMSIDKDTSDLVLHGQKASDYDNSDPVPQLQNVVPPADKTDSYNNPQC
uniref:Integrase catalytic domain-containing protein n=1 Tax=Tanacetum cinerariifolium TaxID=118510 RepID=A0A699ID67_TANCI|nr:hypothetical protein [Tanacetum cinerariifolium]